MFDDLSMRFGEQSVFMDVAAIDFGRDFRKAIDQSVATCSVVLALIGRRWVGSTQPAGSRRLDDVNDFVRIELASALRRDIPVVPVLVQGARMPLEEQLPEDLRELAYRNAIELSHARWKSDVQLLIRALEGPMQTSSAAAVEKTGGERGVMPVDSIAAVEVPAAAIGPQTIEHVSMELAAYIGPIAEVLVKRVAMRSPSVEDLCRIVAQEIEGDGDRAAFLKSCRT